MNSNTAKIVPLSKIASIVGGYPFRSAIEALPAGDVGVLQMANVDPVKGVDSAKAIRVELPAERKPTFLAPDDIVIAARGSNNYAVRIASLDGQFVCTSQFFLIRLLDPTKVDSRFLAWQMNERPSQDYLKREATGSYILNIRREVMDRLPIALPPFDQQLAIAGLAETARSERLALNKLIENRTHLFEAIAVGLHSNERPTP